MLVRTCEICEREEAARLCVVRTQCTVAGDGEQGFALGLGAELLAPQLHRPGCSEAGAGWGGPQPTPVCESWCPVSLGFGPLLLGQPY